jgi:hypothetical protein
MVRSKVTRRQANQSRSRDRATQLKQTNTVEPRLEIDHLKTSVDNEVARQMKQMMEIFRWRLWLNNRHAEGLELIRHKGGWSDKGAGQTPRTTINDTMASREKSSRVKLKRRHKRRKRRWRRWWRRWRRWWKQARGWGRDRGRGKRQRRGNGTRRYATNRLLHRNPLFRLIAAV